MTFGTFAARMQTWQRLLEERVEAQLTVNGVDRAGVEAAMRMIRGQRGGGQAAPPARPAAPTGDRVRVRLPDGRTGNIPRSQLEAARARGAVVL
jgi:hypothetical protein